MFMDLTEFLEKVSGMKLTVYQKEMLKFYASLPKDSCIVMGRKGPMILDGSGKRIDHVKESYERNIIDCKKQCSMWRMVSLSQKEDSSINDAF